MAKQGDQYFRPKNLAEKKNASLAPHFYFSIAGVRFRAYPPKELEANGLQANCQ
jgi:hypothetical protein